MYGVYDDSGKTDLMDSTLKDTLDRDNDFTTKIWPLGPKRFFILTKNLFGCWTDRTNMGTTWPSWI
jgi:hypothetical protein